MRYQFSNCILDLDGGELRRDGIPTKIEPQVFDLLTLLIEQRERVVSAEEIFSTIWRGRAVSPSVLSTRINAVRVAIGDDGRRQEIIRTLRRRGWRFVGTVTNVVTSRIIPPLSETIPSIIVFPLRCDQYRARVFAEQLSEELRLHLSSLQLITVLAETSETKSEPHRAGTAYCLSGTIRTLRDHLQVTMSFIDRATGLQAWTERYVSNSFQDLSIFKTEVAKRTVTAIASHLYLLESMMAFRKNVSDLSSWERIMRALALINRRQKRDWSVARKLLEQNVRNDENDSRSHSLLSYVIMLGVAAGWLHRRNVFKEALESSKKALSFSPEDPWAHLSVGFALAWNGRAEEALGNYQTALDHNPQFGYAHTLRGAALCYLGRADEALVSLKLADQLSRNDLLARGNQGVNKNTIAISHLINGDFNKGVQFGEKALLESPELPTIHRILAANYALCGNSERSRQALRELKRLVPGTSLQSIGEWLPFQRSQDRKIIVEGLQLAGLG